MVICDYPLAAKKMGLVQSHFSINEASMMDVKMIPELIVIGIGLIIIGMGAIMFYLGRYHPRLALAEGIFDDFDGGRLLARCIETDADKVHPPVIRQVIVASQVIHCRSDQVLSLHGGY